ncbi:MAG TPA: hypothetical protein VFF30_12535 [Nitrososphaerales archaeon]|nr:hypothetical protein [Nitrososphaerales archaeon]
MSLIRGWLKQVVPPIAIFLMIDLLLTLVFFSTSSPNVHIGTLRPADAIPPKLGELAVVGAGLGILSTLAYKHIDLSLITLFTAFVVLLDLDHLPSVLGVAQPIRPAHSLAFLGVTLVVLSVVLRNRQPEVGSIFVSSFLGHLAADTGIFALFAPFTFQYFSIDAVRIPLMAGAVAFALLAGYIKNKRRTRIVIPRKVAIIRV